MPAVQQIYIAISQLRYNSNALNLVYKDVLRLQNDTYVRKQQDISFSKSIILKNINYSYPDSSRTALKYRFKY